MPAARCLDLTRLISRIGRGQPTGVDRVELAYLRRLLADEVPLYLLVRTWLGHLILDQNGAEAVLDRFDRRAKWGPVDTLGRLQRRAHPMKRRAEADLRRMAVARAPKGRLTRALRRVFPRSVTYVNVGHSNLDRDTLAGGRLWLRRMLPFWCMIRSRWIFRSSNATAVSPGLKKRCAVSPPTRTW